VADIGRGLAIANGASGPDALLSAYRRPVPRLAEGRILAAHVHAMMDVSDGLLIDAARMAAASGLAVTIDLAAIPLSAAYIAHIGNDRTARLQAATAGDDYQLLFAAAASRAIPARRIGSFGEGQGLILVDGAETVALPPLLGFEHGRA
jgi:thiamine-monophosphate kinase